MRTTTITGQDGGVSWSSSWSWSFSVFWREEFDDGTRTITITGQEGERFLIVLVVVVVLGPLTGVGDLAVSRSG
jgi:hypothetical protein